jgi:CheY-like chemotaxis protein
MGSKFSVRLPLEPGLPDQTSSPEAQDAPAFACPRSIVLVEDNPDVAQPLMLALEHAGYRVTLFTDAVSAIAGLSDLKPDAVLLDIGLPGIDGYELAAQLRKKQNLRNRLFVAISGFRKRQTPEAPDHFDHYFTKPVNVGSLLNVLRSALVDAEPTVAGTSPAPEKGALQALLIDDHVGLATAMANLLNREGLEVRTAFSGEEGLRCASDLRPQLILCDLNLPDMGGHEVVRKLRSNPATRHAYSVILTALSEAEVRTFNDEAKEIGVDEFIRKPMMPDVVHSLVAKLRR